MTEPNLGTEDLEKGMCPSSAGTFGTVALNALIVLLLFNSAGLVKWTQQLSSNTVNVWLAERAADWDRIVHSSSAKVMGILKKLLSGL
jgi:hypothetical protein